MTASLSGLRVWITRPANSDESLAAWRSAGAQPRSVPLVRLERSTPGAAVRARLGIVEQGTWIFTSANAARFVRQFLRELPDGARLQAFPALAIGQKTGEVAASLAFDVVATASRATGADFAAEVTPLLRNRTALLPGSDRRRPEVEDTLRSQDVAVVAFTVYRTWPQGAFTPEDQTLLEQGMVDAVALYSPSAVEGWKRCVRQTRVAPPALPPVLVLGPTTREAAAAAGLDVVAEAENPGEAELLEATAAWWSQRSPDPA